MEPYKRNPKTNIKCTTFNVASVVALVFFIIAMICVVGTLVWNIWHNPINALLKSTDEAPYVAAISDEQSSDTNTTDEKSTTTTNSSKEQDITSVSVSAIEATASNAISSTTLIVTVLGVFITGLSIFAAISVFMAKTKIEEVDLRVDSKLIEVDTKIEEINSKYDIVKLKMEEVDKKMQLEEYMRHVFLGLNYWTRELYIYAISEFKLGLENEDLECQFISNYNLAAIHIDLYGDNFNFSYLEKAEENLKKAIEIGTKQANQKLLSDAFFTLGCLYGLMAEAHYNSKNDSFFVNNFLNNSEDNILKGICHSFESNEAPLALYFKNLAVTYVLLKDIENAKNMFITGINLDAKERGIIDKVKLHEHAKKFLKKAYSGHEKELVSEDTIAEIEEDILKSYDIPHK
jgi:tetratricopeptide (TPR) repeat protein